MKMAGNDGDFHKPYEPTAKDIRRACESIQQSWSPRERNRRAGRHGNAGWSPPNLNWSAVADAFADSQSDAPGTRSLPDDW